VLQLRANIEWKSPFLNRQTDHSFHFLFMCNSKHSSVCLRYEDNDDVNFSRTIWSFRPFPVVTGHADWWVRLPTWAFLLVFHSNHMPKTHRICPTAWDRQTDRQTDGRTDRQTDCSVVFTLVGGGIMNCKLRTKKTLRVNTDKPQIERKSNRYISQHGNSV